MVEALRLYVLIGPPETDGANAAADGDGQDGWDPAHEAVPGPEPDPAQVAAVVALARAAIEGGATMLQLRAKGRSTRDLLGFARALLACCRPAGVGEASTTHRPGCATAAPVPRCVSIAVRPVTAAGGSS